MKQISKLALTGLLLAGSLQTVHAAVGDTLTLTFDTQSSPGSVPTVNQATLLMTETALGVDFLLSPNWLVTSGNRVDNVFLVFSGEALSFVDGAGPTPSFATSTGQIDASYSTTNLVALSFGSSGPTKLDNPSTSAWSLNGGTITLADFSFAATSNSKPAPAFASISLPGAQPSNWVALAADIVPAPTSVVPEPSAYALMLAGLGALAVVRRRRNQT